MIGACSWRRSSRFGGPRSPEKRCPGCATKGRRAMRTSQHLVSLRTFGLAFAVVLSPAVMQSGGSCTPASGDTEATGGDGGSAGTGGMGGDGGIGGSIGDVFPCTEQGVRDAIAQGGGPHYFACDGSMTAVMGNWGIHIGRDVILDGEGKLTIESVPSNCSNCYLSIGRGVTAELRRLTVRGHIENLGALTLTNSTVSGGDYTAIYSLDALTLHNSTVSSTSFFPALITAGQSQLAAVNSTISTEAECALYVGCWCLFSCNICEECEYDYGTATATLSSSTIVGGICIASCGEATIARTLVEGQCNGVTSLGYNITSPGDTCSFDPDGTDQVNVSADDLKLGELADNGGPTMTHALEAGSVAIDHIPAVDCGVTTDQRGEPRPVGDGCDVGSFERQPEDP